MKGFYLKNSGYSLSLWANLQIMFGPFLKELLNGRGIIFLKNNSKAYLRVGFFLIKNINLFATF